MHPSCTLPNTQKWVKKGTFAPIPCTLHTPYLTLIRASYGSCSVEYCSTVLSVRCGPSSVNIDLTVHSRPDSRKSGTMLHIGVVDMRTTSFVIVIPYCTSNNIVLYWRMNHCTCLVVGALCMFKWLPCFALLRRKSGNACCNQFFPSEK